MSGEGTCLVSCKLNKYVKGTEPCTVMSLLNKFEHVCRGGTDSTGAVYRGYWVLGPCTESEAGDWGFLQTPLIPFGQTDTTENITFVTPGWLVLIMEWF